MKPMKSLQGWGSTAVKVFPRYRTLLALFLSAAAAATAQAQAAPPIDQAWILYEKGRALQDDRGRPEPGHSTQVT